LCSTAGIRVHRLHMRVEDTPVDAAGCVLSVTIPFSRRYLPSAIQFILRAYLYIYEANFDQEVQFIVRVVKLLKASTF
jgi:hypothetical protein